MMTRNCIFIHVLIFFGWVLWCPFAFSEDDESHPAVFSPSAETSSPIAASETKQAAAPVAKDASDTEDTGKAEDLPAVDDTIPVPDFVPPASGTSTEIPVSAEDEPPLPSLPSARSDSETTPSDVPAVPVPANTGPEVVLPDERSDEDALALEQGITDVPPPEEMSAFPDTNAETLEIDPTQSQPIDRQNASNPPRNRADNAEPGVPLPKRKPQTRYGKVVPSSAIYRKAYNKENSHLPKARYVEEEITLLFQAVAKNNAEIIRTLVEKFNTTEIRDEEGNTPLLYAAMLGNMNSLLSLLILDADPDAKNKLGLTPLMVTTYKGRIDLAALLLRYGATADVLDASGKTPLFTALERGYADVADILVDAGASVNHQMRNGDTPLHLAIYLDNSPAAYWLVKRGASVETRNYRGLTPLMLAASLDRGKISNLLLQVGADLDKRDAQGRTARDFALQHQGTSVLAAIDAELLERGNLRDRLLSSSGPVTGIPLPKLQKDQDGKFAPVPVLKRQASSGKEAS